MHDSPDANCREKSMALRHVAVPIGLAISLAGCGAIGAIDLPWHHERPPAPIQQAAVPPVETTTLPPPGGADGQLAAAVPPDDMETQPLPQPNSTAAAAPPTTNGLGRTDLLGGWTISTGSDSCQLFMTLTSWTGGYRASTRGCNSDLLKSISAWNLDAGQVVLAGQGGAPVAHLASSGNNRFDGAAIANDAPVTFYR
jgi:hypothetical protein